MVETGEQLRFSYPDGDLAAVRLRADLLKRLPPPEFERDADGWHLRLPRPATVDRFEYELELVRPDGSSELVPDPDAPAVPGPFGEKSVLELPGYRPPAWLDDDEAPAGSLRRLRLRSRRLRATVTGLLWSAPGTEPDASLPLLVVHDGPEYAEYSQLLRYLEHLSAEREVPPMRAALLAPVDRNQTYSASARYSSALVRDLLPELARLAPSPPGPESRVGMGASLGAIAMLHAHRRHPGVFGGLFLQSGSFFRQRYDGYESRFVRFRRISRFMGHVLTAETWPDPVPVGMTCGTGEENLANNRAAFAALGRQGYPVDLEEVRDGHNWTSWRDGFDPHLPTLLARVWP
jgi:enterochelin esterase-like enzyme